MCPVPVAGKLPQIGLHVRPESVSLFRAIVPDKLVNRLVKESGIVFRKRLYPPLGEMSGRLFYKVLQDPTSTGKGIPKTPAPMLLPAHHEKPEIQSIRESRDRQSLYATRGRYRRKRLRSANRTARPFTLSSLIDPKISIDHENTRISSCKPNQINAHNSR